MLQYLNITIRKRNTFDLLRSTYNVYYCTNIPKSNEERYKRIFRFPYIAQCATLARLKVYQTGITSVACPYFIYEFLNGNIPAEQCYSSCGVAMFAFMMLFVIEASRN